MNVDGTIKDKSLKVEQVDSDKCITLLTRCIKMYEAKQVILRLLKMSMEKDRMTDKLKNNKYKNESDAQNTLIQIRRLGNRITSQIVAL